MRAYRSCGRGGWKRTARNSCSRRRAGRRRASSWIARSSISIDEPTSDSSRRWRSRQPRIHGCAGCSRQNLRGRDEGGGDAVSAPEPEQCQDHDSPARRSTWSRTSGRIRKLVSCCKRSISAASAVKIPRRLASRRTPRSPVIRTPIRRAISRPLASSINRRFRFDLGCDDNRLAFTAIHRRA